MIPLGVTCYNRPAMLARVLQALKDQAFPGPLYLFSDGPHDDPQVLEVHELCRAVDWAEKIVVFHKHNISQKRAIPYAMDYMLNRHEAAVQIEDDVVPHPYFWEFMASCLERYKDERQVYGVCGYTRTLPEEIVSEYPFDAHFYPRVGTAAWGTWRDKWRTHTERDLPAMARKAEQAGLDLTLGGEDLPRGLARWLEHKTANWSLAWLMNVALRGGYFLYPMRTLCSNIGHGTGVSHSRHHGPPLIFPDRPLDNLPDRPFRNTMVYEAMRALYP